MLHDVVQPWIYNFGEISLILYSRGTAAGSRLTRIDSAPGNITTQTQGAITNNGDR